MLTGGDAITGFYQGAPIDGTLGLVVSGHGAATFVTAGHAVGEPLDSVYADGRRIGVVAMNPYRASADGADIALVLLYLGVEAQPYAIPHAVSRFDVVLRGDAVTMSGAGSGEQRGRVLLAPATVRDATCGRLQDGVAVASYTSARADAGAPVWSCGSDGIITLAGFHGGHVQLDGVLRSWFVPVLTAAKLLGFRDPGVARSSRPSVSAVKEGRICSSAEFPSSPTSMEARSTRRSVSSS